LPLAEYTLGVRPGSDPVVAHLWAGSSHQLSQNLILAESIVNSDYPVIRLTVGLLNTTAWMLFAHICWNGLVIRRRRRDTKLIELGLSRARDPGNSVALPIDPP
jgi:hypothetical protein